MKNKQNTYLARQKKLGDFSYLSLFLLCCVHGVWSLKKTFLGGEDEQMGVAAGVEQTKTNKHTKNL